MRFDGRRYRPMGLLDLFDEAFDLYKGNFALFTLITGAVYVPVIGIGSYLAAPSLHGLSLTSVDDWQQILGSVEADPSRVGAIVPIFALLISLMIGALVAAASALYLDEPISVAKAFRVAAPICVQAAIWLLVFAIAAVVGYAFYVFPFIFLLAFCVPYQTFIHVMINENVRSPFRPLQRAYRISKSYGGFLLGGSIMHAVLLAALVEMVVTVVDLVLGWVVNASIPLLPMLALHKDIADTIAGELTIMLLLPYHICVLTLFYFNMRIAKEGFDMEILARSLKYPAVTIAPVEPFPKIRPARQRVKP